MKKKFNLDKNDIIIFLIPFIIYLIALIIFYPGILSFDSYNQLEQISKWIYTNAHPFFHTFIEMICILIYNSPSSIAFLQLTIFSFVWMYICKYNRKNDSPKLRNFEIILTIIIAINPINSIMSI